jgi:hypothetical protein
LDGVMGFIQSQFQRKVSGYGLRCERADWDKFIKFSYGYLCEAPPTNPDKFRFL